MNVTIPDALVRRGKLALAFASVALAFVAGRYEARHPILPRPTPAPTPVEPKKPDTPTPPPAPTPAPKPDWFGLSYPADGSHRAVIASIPRLSQAAPELLARDASDGRPILLYRAWTDLFSAFPPYPAQQIGDCVSMGHARGNDLLQCIDFCLAHPGSKPGPADVQETDTEALYGMAREVAGMLGSGDGCYGGAAVKAMTTQGVVSRRMLGTSGVYSGQRARQWGRRGTPQSVKDLAAHYKLGSAAAVTTWDELVAAQHAGSPVTICTALGFTLERDAQGFVRRKGRWGHCMFIAGIRFDRPGACVIQSWGPDVPSGPTALGQPSYSFWIDRADVEAILSEGDSWAISRSPHFSSAGRRRRSLPPHWRAAA